MIHYHTLYRSYDEISNTVKRPHENGNIPHQSVVNLSDLIKCGKKIYHHRTSFDILQMASKVHLISGEPCTFMTVYDDIDNAIYITRLNLISGSMDDGAKFIKKCQRDHIHGYSRIVKQKNKYIFGINGYVHLVKSHGHGAFNLKKCYEFENAVIVDMVAVDERKIMVGTVTPHVNRSDALVISDFIVYMVDVELCEPVGFMYEVSSRLYGMVKPICVRSMGVFNYTFVIYDPHGNIVIYDLKNAKKHNILARSNPWMHNGLVQACYVLSNNLFITLESVKEYNERTESVGKTKCVVPKDGMDVPLLNIWRSRECTMTGTPSTTLDIYGNNKSAAMGSITLFQSNGLIYLLGGAGKRYMTVLNIQPNHPAVGGNNNQPR